MVKAKTLVRKRRIYVEETKAFNERFHDYWKAWRSEQKTNPVAAR